MLAGHVTFHIASINGEILALGFVEIATQVHISTVFIPGSFVECEDLFGQLGVSIFQFRIRLGHKVVDFTVLESWVLSDLVPWMLLAWVTGLHVAGQIFGYFSHVTTLTAHDALE